MDFQFTPHPLDELQDQAVAWANARGLIEQTTPLAQAEKTQEEVGEAIAAIEHYINSVDSPETARAVALELGDILVTLALGAHLQGSPLRETLEQFYLGSQGRTFATRTSHATSLNLALDELLRAVHSGPRPAIVYAMGHLVNVVNEIAKTLLNLSAENCLAMALEKIQNRTGKVEGQKFVKDS